LSAIYTTEQTIAIAKAMQLLEDAELIVERDDRDMESDGAERWCIHPEEER
tara:strand:+ start:306 stop:458 length:153 start_codon:yes stop_codon:yes gene_type:complete